MPLAENAIQRLKSLQTLGAPAGGSDPLLWRHACRTAELARRLGSLRSLSDVSLDYDALHLAGLAHELGWALDVGSGRVDRLLVLTRPTTDEQRHAAAEWVAAELSPWVEPPVLRTAGEIILNIAHRATKQVEAHLLSEADSLDVIGPFGVVLAIRRCAGEGREVDAVVQTWARQQEYHYWEARIRDQLRFESSRELAWQRLAAVEPFLQSLGAQLRGEGPATGRSEATSPLPQKDSGG